MCQCGVLPLAIETGRYTNTPVDQRLYRLCNTSQIEDESHFVCQCILYKTMRTELYLHVSSIYPTNFIILTPNEQLKVHMSEQFIYLTIYFVEQAWRKRQSVMFNYPSYIYILFLLLF